MNGMHLRQPTEREVVAAAASIVDAFSATDTHRYFSAFASEASFIFHTEGTRLESRAAYEQLWSRWIGEGWRVLACDSSNHSITVFPGGAVFAHDVATTVQTQQGEEAYRERETIVFRQDGDAGLTAVHEHLSAYPTSTE